MMDNSAYRTKMHFFRKILINRQLLQAGLLLLLSNIAMAHTAPHMRQSLFNMGPQLPVPHLGTTIIYQALPAQQGTDFDGPDPGLNAAIISVPQECPNNYMKDNGGRCRPAFEYNPLATFSPEKYKGSIQFYMGLQIGRPAFRNRRRQHHRMRGRPRAGRLHLRRPSTTPPSAHLPASPTSILPTPPPLTGAVAEITAILEMLQKDGVEDQPPQGLLPEVQITEGHTPGDMTEGHIAEGHIAVGQPVDDDDD